MPFRSRVRRGFTLLEVMTTVVIVLILTSLAVTGMMYGMGRARMNNAVFDAAALYSTAQLRALSYGVPHFIMVRQTGDGLVRIHMLERPDFDPPIDFNDLDLSAGPDVALAYDLPQPPGPPVRRNALDRDRLVLGTSTGPDTGGLAFLDLNSPRLPRPLPAPFSTLPLDTPFNPPDLNLPSNSLLAGCSFCINPRGEAYGVIRFNPDGTIQVLTGGAPSGAVIAFMPNTSDETHFAPKLLTLSAPSGALNVF